jgi:hypothetical protein
MLSMPHTPKTTSRLALLPVEDRRQEGRPAVRRYRLGRVIDDLGAAVAGAPAPRAIQTPSRGVRAP